MARVALIALVVLALVGSAAAAPHLYSEQEYQFLFKSFRTQFNKEYHHDEFFVRYENFKENLDMIKAHNAQGLSWQLGVNEFADMTWEEFRAKHLGYKMIVRDYIRSQNVANLTAAPPASIDWQSKGAVTPIKNQGQCGGCWAFSTTGSIEGAHEIATGSLVSLSEQQLIDCSTSYGNEGCNGGVMDYGFEYAIAHGLCTEASYPYKAVNGVCKASQCTAAVHITSYKNVQSDSEAALETAVGTVGPVSVAVEADQSGFQFYTSGVFSGTCGTALDHGVLAVGYGTSAAGQKFWKVKNSWGATWGDEGYIYLAKDISSKAGQCGIAMEPSYPIA